MKKIFALVLTFVMIFSISASAASGLVPANLQYNNIKINLNGNNVATSAEPFIIDGTTYLPVRALAEALGLAVEWDATTNTVKLINQELVGKISLAQYNSLTTGMTYEQVVGILGSPGELSTEIDFGADFASLCGYRFSRIYTWNGIKDFSSALLTFKDNILESKIQYGLE